MDHPNPNDKFPIPNCDRTCFLKNIIKSKQIIVADYTYYDDPDDVHNFENNVLYLFDFTDDKLIFGKFCQIATGVRFIMNGSNHAMNGVSTYPFKVFGKSWKDASLDVKTKGNTVIGNDVWIGNSATIMQGITIGDGAIIGTNAVITKDIEPYSIVAGNPARLIRKRFNDDQINLLLKLSWWNWPIDKITQYVDLITSADFEKLNNLL